MATAAERRRRRRRRSARALRSNTATSGIAAAAASVQKPQRRTRRKSARLRGRTSATSGISTASSLVRGAKARKSSSLLAKSAKAVSPTKKQRDRSFKQAERKAIRASNRAVRQGAYTSEAKASERYPNASPEFQAALKESSEPDERTPTEQVLFGPEGLGQGDAPMIGPLNAIRKGALKVRRVLDDAAETAKKSAKETAKSNRRMEKAIARGERRQLPKRTRAKEAVKRREFASKAGRQAKLRRKANTLAFIGGSAPVGAAVGASIAGRSVEATIDDPIKTAKTTGRAIAGMPTALVGDLADAATGNFDPLVQSQVDYYKMLSEISTGSSEEAKKIIQEDAGLVPALSVGLLGLSSGGAARGFRPEPRAGIRARRAHKRGDVDKLDKIGEGARRNHDRRKEVAELAAAKGDSGRRAAARDMDEIEKPLRKLSKEKVDGRVRGNDVVQFVGREGVPLDAKRGAAYIRESVLPRLRDDDTDIDPKEIGTREVAEAIIRRPEVLESPNLAAALTGARNIETAVGRERGEMETGKPVAPIADDRAKQVHQARALDVRTPEERVPGSLRETSRVKPRMDQDAAKAIRGEARNLLNRAKRLEAQAAALRRTRPERAQILDRRVGMYRSRAEKLLKGVNRLRLADGMERLATRLERGEESLRVPKRLEGMSPDELRSQAAALRRAHFSEADETMREFSGEMATARSQAGLEDPIYFRESDARDTGPVGGSNDYVGSRIPAQEKMRTGHLAEKGGIRESGKALTENVVRARMGIAAAKFVRQMVDRFALKDGDNIQIFTGPEFRRAQRRGEIPPGYTIVPTSEINRTLQRGRWTEAQGLIESAPHKALREARGVDGKKYVAMPKAAWDEFKAQQMGLDRFWKGMSAVARIQSIGLLAYNPLWFMFQLGASPLVLLARNPNLFRWPEAMMGTAALWRRTSKEERDNFASEFGGTTADIVRITDDVQIRRNPDHVNRLSDAAKVANASWAGRLLHYLFVRGGPLIGGNRRYEAAVRQFDAMLEMDRMIREERRPEVHRYAQSLSRLNETVRAQIRDLKGMSREARIEYFNRNPEAMNELSRRVNDGLGNWNAMTMAERKAASVMIFYPFLRFSLRWAFYAFPKNNPLKTALYLNLSQQNADELEDVLGRKPGFFNDYGKIVTHIGGEPQVALNLSRMAPGMNAAIEAGFGSQGNLQKITSPLQPAIGSLLSASAGQDPFTGRDTEDSFLSIFAQDMAGLPVPARPLVNDPSKYSILLRRIRGEPEGGYAREITPRVAVDLDKEREAQRVGALMTLAFEGSGPESTAAEAELNQLLVQYGLPGAEEEETSDSSPYLSGSSSPSDLTDSPYLSGSSSSSPSSSPYLGG